MQTIYAEARSGATSISRRGSTGSAAREQRLRAALCEASRGRGPYTWLGRLDAGRVIGIVEAFAARDWVAEVAFAIARIGAGRGIGSAPLEAATRWAKQAKIATLRMDLARQLADATTRPQGRRAARLRSRRDLRGYCRRLRRRRSTLRRSRELAKGTGIIKTAKLTGLGTGTVHKLRRQMEGDDTLASDAVRQQVTLNADLATGGMSVHGERTHRADGGKAIGVSPCRASASYGLGSRLRSPR